MTNDDVILRFLHEIRAALEERSKRLGRIEASLDRVAAIMKDIAALGAKR